MIIAVADAQRAILGGELWWVPEGAREWSGLLPQKTGPDGLYPWTTVRASGESWRPFVGRCARESTEQFELVDELLVTLVRP